MTTSLQPQRTPQATKLPAGEVEGSRTGRGLLALLGALVLLVGVPVGLVLFVGNPLPTTAPSSSWLNADVTADLVIDVLAVLVWVVWVHFCVCFLTEWRAVRRGRMPGRVVMGGGSQVLARQLVAGILLLAGGATLAHGLSTAVATPDAAAPQTGQQTSQTIAQHRAERPADATARDAADAGAALGDATGTARAPTRYTQVKPPEGRHHDTLWNIAERTLGNPLRWKEIYQLNQDRVQPDGARLTDADLIRPGWQLVLPADAHGPDVRVMQHGAHGHAGGLGHDDAATWQSAGEAAHGAVADAVSEPGAEIDSPAAAAPSADDQQGSSGIASLLLGGGLILAGVARALTARRGPYGEPDTDDVALAAAAGFRRSELLDDALRSLAEMRSSQVQPMPDVLFCYLSDDQVILHLAADSPAPAQPWTVSEDGRVWTLRADQLVRPGAGVPAPYPSLVNVAGTHGFDILVDLELAPGLISLGGDETSCRDLATAAALDLSMHAWSDAVDVVMVGFGEHLVDVGTGRARQVDDLDALLGELGDDHREQGSVLSRLGVQGVLQGRQRGAAHACTPTVVVLSAPPTSEQAQRLAALTAGGRTSLSVLCVGDSPSARWRFVVTPQGQFEALALGIHGEARRLNVAAQRELRALLAKAAAARSAGEARLESARPAAVAEEILDDVTPAASMPRAHGDSSAEVTIRLLGPVTVEAPGPLDEERRALLTEVAVMALLHPEGLHEAVLRSSIWPRGVEADVVRARVSETQAWLGQTGDGPRLHADTDGRLRLRGVASDHRDLADAARAEGAPAELAGLRAALMAGTGPVFSGDGDDYHWLAFAREARQCRMLVTSAATRAAELATRRGEDPLAVEQLLRQGLRLVPASQVLWRTLLRFLHGTDPDGVRGVVDEMYSTLDGAGERHDPETEALVQQLVPQRERATGS